MPVETNGGGGGTGHCPPGPQRDSGCYGSSDTVGHGSGPMCRDASEQTTGLCRLPLTEENERAEDDEEDEDEEGGADDVGTQTMGPGSMSMGASPSVKKTRIKLPTSALRMPRSNVHGDIECRLEINPDGYVANVFCNRGVKGPVAARTAPGNNVGSPRSSIRQPQPQPHFAAPGQKLAGLSLRNHADQISPFVPVSCVRPTAAHSVTSSSSSNSSQHRPVGGGPRASSSFRQEKHAKHFSPKKPVQTTEKLVEEKLRVEHIRLSDHPYSNENGQFGIPLRLIQRYCAELERDLRQVALAMEHIRDTQLREQRRPVVSHIEEILTDRYLNCDCIKTDSIADFLVTLGLPMYIPSVLTRLQRDKITPSVDNLLRLSESDLVEQIGFTTIHSRWLKEAFVPSMLGKSKMAYLDKV